MRLFIAICVAMACVNAASAAFDMRSSYDLIDADMNGVVSHAEFSGLFDTFDDNGNKEIDGAEFVAHFVKTNMSVQGSVYVFFVTDMNNDQKVNATEVDSLFYAFDIEDDSVLTFNEYASSMNTILAQLSIAAAAQPRLDMLFDGADANADGVLAPEEFWNLLDPADLDNNDIISENEFTTYWREKTLDTEDRAHRLFHILDFDGTPGLGSDLEKNILFTSFDYGKNGTVSKEEFENVMLSLFSQVMVDVSVELVQSYANTNLNRLSVFTAIDTNMDSKLSADEVVAKNKLSDVDNDGIVNASEFVIAHVKMGFSAKFSVYSLFMTDANSDNVIDDTEVRMKFYSQDQNLDSSISMDEFNRGINFAEAELEYVAQASPKLAAMIYAIDTNGDDVLTVDELRTLTTAADRDGDGDLMKDDFVMYWTTHTGLPDVIGSKLFDILDPNMDGVSSVAERTQVFASFDYDKNGMVTVEEFSNSLLFLYARFVKEIRQEIWEKFRGTFNSTQSFQRVDANKDGMLDATERDAFFTAADTNGDNLATATEFITGYLQTGLDIKGVIYLMYRIDENEDLQISKTEFDNSLDSFDLNDDDKISQQEYVTVWSSLLHQLSEASVAAAKESKMFDFFDKDKNGNMTLAEMRALFAYADADKNGLVSKAEFKTTWMYATGEPADRTELLFDIIDGDDDGSFGNDQEIQQLYDGFDYVDDNMVTKEEFTYSLLNLFARTVEALELQRKANSVVGFFF